MQYSFLGRSISPQSNGTRLFDPWLRSDLKYFSNFVLNADIKIMVTSWSHLLRVLIQRKKTLRRVSLIFPSFREKAYYEMYLIADEDEEHVLLIRDAFCKSVDGPSSRLDSGEDWMWYRVLPWLRLFCGLYFYFNFYALISVFSNSISIFFNFHFPQHSVRIRKSDHVSKALTWGSEVKRLR